MSQTTSARSDAAVVRRSKAGTLLAGSIAVLLVWAALIYHLHSRELAIREQAHHDAANLSIGVEKHIERLLVGVDQVMQFIADDFARDPGSFDFSAWMRRSTSLEGVTHQITLFNEFGEMLASRVPMTPGMPSFTVRDRAYFQALSARSDLGLYIDRTVKGRITGRYVLQTARRLAKPDGSFAGVIVTSIDPNYLSQQFKEVDVGRGGSIAMFGTDGYVRARYPQREGMYDLNAMKNVSNGVFANLRDRPAGTYELESAFDHVTRIFGYRAVGSLPLIVTIGKSLDDVMVPFERERRRAILAGAGITALLLAILMLRLRAIGHDRRQAAVLAAANRTLADRETAAVRAEAQAREANRLLTMAAQIAHIGHWRIVLPGNTVWWSDEIFRIHGLDTTQGVPELGAAIEVYHPDDRAEVVRCVNEALTSGQGFEFAARVVRPGGELRHVVSRGLCELDAEGSTIAVFGTIMDVTELRQTERAAIESERRYRMLADNTNDMIVQADMDTTRRYVSPASRKLLGYEPHELVGTRPLAMVHPDDRPEVAALMAELATGTRKSAILRQRYRRKDGTYLWVDVSYQLFHDDEGRPLGCIACTRDASEQQAQADALRRSERLYRLLAENTSELIILGHDDGSRSYISPASERLLGFTPDELGAMSLKDYVHPEDLSKLFATTSRLARGSREVTCLYRTRHKFFGWIWVEGSFRRIPDAIGDEASIVATFRDVSERERQARLLEEAKAQAEAGARVKADFLANMSHELRTPLTGMLGVHDLLRADETLADEQHRLVDLAQQAGRSLLAIVNDVLDFSKIEAGELHLEALPFGLRSLIDACRQIAGEGMTNKAVTLKVDVAQDAPDWLVGDPTRLRQVLLNLTTNALKFTSEGSVTLRAGYDASSSRLRITVTDSGIGIDAETLPFLFERFSQADNSMSRRYGGTGLGLAICKRLVQLMGGEIGAESQPGRGSTFWFEVPLAVAEAGRSKTSIRSLLATEATRALRVLVAEDNRMNQEIIQTILSRKGHDVTMVGDGFAAVAAVKAGPAFDMVLMDVQMPSLDGIEATGAIRAWEQAEGCRPTPIIALTANAMAEEVARCRQAGMDEHVAKPIEWSVLFETMDRLALGSAHRLDRQVSPPAAPILDRDLLDGVADLLGPERLGAMLRSFIDDVDSRLCIMESSTATPRDISTNAHALVSQAGQLGFLELSTLSAQIEQGAQTGGGLAEIRRLRDASTRAIAAVAPYALAG